MNAVAVARPRARSFWFVLPLVLLVAAAVLANLGMDPTPRAVGATSDTVTVTATVGSTLDVADVCSPTLGAMNFTIAMGAYSEGSCAINFGASNDSQVNLRVDSSAGAFFSPAGFADAGGTCENLATVDEVGLKVVSVTAPTTNQWGCTAGAGNASTGHKAVPDAPTNVCQSAALGTTNTCTIGIGVLEVGSNATAGDYVGTLALDVVG